MNRFLRPFRSLYVQVLCAVFIAVVLGTLKPEFAASMKPLGDGFIKLVKMLIAPIVFATVVTGIAKMGDLKKVGRVGLKGILYFEVLTTVALAIGLGVGEARPSRLRNERGPRDPGHQGHGRLRHRGPTRRTRPTSS